MRLVLSDYLRTLKERDELDKLLPELASSMGLTPLTKTQRGTRQFGVDLAAAGQDPENIPERKLFLFLVKAGNIGRSEWDSGPQSVRQSLNDILDVYFRSSVSSAHKNLPLVIVLATSGDLKEEVNANWSGYTNDHKDKAEYWSDPRKIDN